MSHKYTNSPAYINFYLVRSSDNLFLDGKPDRISSRPLNGHLSNIYSVRACCPNVPSVCFARRDLVFAIAYLDNLGFFAINKRFISDISQYNSAITASRGSQNASAVGS